MALDPEVRELILAEITTFFIPVGKQMDFLTQQNEEHAVQVNNVLNINRDQNEKLDKVYGWMLEFWGNGSGKTGYFERRVRHDDERYQKLFVSKNEMELERVRKAERAAVLAEIAAQSEVKSKRLREWLLILIPFVTGGAIIEGIHLAKQFAQFLAK